MGRGWVRAGSKARHFYYAAEHMAVQYKEGNHRHRSSYVQYIISLRPLLHMASFVAVATGVLDCPNSRKVSTPMSRRPDTRSPIYSNVLANQSFSLCT